MDSQPIRSGRLSTVAAALVIARRDFVAILWSRSFIFFLLGPLFPIVVGLMAGGIGQQVEQQVDRPELGIAMSAADTAALMGARERLETRLGGGVPKFVIVTPPAAGETFDARAALAGRRGNLAAIASGTLANPVLTGPKDRIEAWQGPVSLIAAEARTPGLRTFPRVGLVDTATSTADQRRSRMLTAQAGQTLLFLLTMLLAGMVLSNLVEEKANKIIEILAAAIPMDAVFLGKLFAMLGVSLVGISVWGGTVLAFTGLAGGALPNLPPPAVGWGTFVALGVIYFSLAYLLLGSLFLAIGSLATTVREVQTLSMPVTMLQLLVFFFATYAMASPGSPAELAAVLVPFSSPFAMIARAAQDPALWPHGAAIAWQVMWVTLSVKAGAALFRKRVMKSGSAGAGAKRGLLARLRPATAGSR
jgi:ABC-2 type transport system permease protein